MSFPWLTVDLVVPLVGSVAVVALPRRNGSTLPKQVALGFSLLTLLFAVLTWTQYSAGKASGGARFQLTELHAWITAFGTSYSLGLDGIGLTLLLLTTVLTPVVIVASWNDGEAGRWSVHAFFAWMLLLEGLAVGVFLSTDVFLFYVFFEATLIPIYFLVGGYGGPRRAYAATKFLIYNLVGGLVMLASVIGLYVESAKQDSGPSYLFTTLSQLHLSTGTGRWLFVGFFIAFAIKAPLWPLHTWLPDAADESTSGTAVLMVSVLDKVGTFGMIRFCLGLFPEASRWATPLILVLAVISILYGATAAIAQNNLTRLVAYSSVSHFGFIVLGIFVLNSYGQVGSTLYMFNHGISTAAMFLMTGFMIKRRGSRLISDYGGMEKVAPILAGLLLLSGLSSLALPGLSPFVSEFLVLVGTFTHDWGFAVFAVIAIVLAALYILQMYRRTMTGPLQPEIAGLSDLNVREIAAMAPLVALIVVLGFFPKPLTDIINPTVATTLQHVGATDPRPQVPAATTAQEAPK